MTLKLPRGDYTSEATKLLFYLFGEQEDRPLPEDEVQGRHDQHHHNNKSDNHQEVVEQFATSWGDNLFKFRDYLTEKQHDLGKEALLLLTLTRVKSRFG